MSIPRYNPKRDAAEQAIVDALEKVGVHVWRLDTPADLLCWRLGKFYVLEVKDPRARKDKRQVDQIEFLELTRAPVVRTPEQALRAVGAMR